MDEKPKAVEEYEVTWGRPDALRCAVEVEGSVCGAQFDHRGRCKGSGRHPRSSQSECFTALAPALRFVADLTERHAGEGRIEVVLTRRGTPRGLTLLALLD